MNGYKLNSTGENLNSKISILNKLTVDDNDNLLFNGSKVTPYKFLTEQTLTAGETTLTFTDSSITDNSKITPWCSIFGIIPTSITASTGSVVIVFEAQTEDMQVTLKIE